jgi:MFS family permease
VSGATTDPDGRRAARRAAFAIAPGVLFAGVAGGIAFPILPIVGLHAGLPLPFIGLILAANRIARIFASPAVGVLCDRLGGRLMLLGGLVVQIAVMALYWAGIAFDRPGIFFLFGRLLHGPGSAGIFVAAQVLALQAGGRLHGGMTAGIVRASLSAGMPVGMVVGGLLSARFGDQATFAAAMAAVAVAAVVAWLRVPDLRTAGAGQASMRARLQVMAQPRVLALGTLNFATFFSAQGTVLTTLVLLIAARHLTLDSLSDKTMASLSMGVLVVFSAGASVIAGRLGDRWRAHTGFGLGGMAILIAGLVAMIWADSPAALFAATGLVGCGMGTMNPSLVALVGLFVKAELRGSAVGAVQLLGDIGGSLGPVVGATLLMRSTGAPFAVSAVVVALALLIGPWLVRAERASRAGAELETIAESRGEP